MTYKVKHIVTQGVDSDYVTLYDIHFRRADFSWSDTRIDGSVLVNLWLQISYFFM